MQKASATLVVRYVIEDGLKQLVLLPVWWYTSGLKRVFLSTLGSMKSATKFFGLDVWIKNLFVPMYGETELVGKLISFGVRLFVIIVRGVAVLGAVVLAWAGFFLYLIVLPIVVVYTVVNLLALLF